MCARVRASVCVKNSSVVVHVLKDKNNSSYAATTTVLLLCINICKSIYKDILCTGT